MKKILAMLFSISCIFQLYSMEYSNNTNTNTAEEYYNNNDFQKCDAALLAAKESNNKGNTKESIDALILSVESVIQQLRENFSVWTSKIKADMKREIEKKCSKLKRNIKKYIRDLHSEPSGTLSKSIEKEPKGSPKIGKIIVTGTRKKDEN